MTKEDIKDYSLKIAQSSKSRLVVVTYDIILNYINSAKINYENNQIECFIFDIKKAKQFVDNLLSSLDFKYKMSLELMSIYLFVNRCLIEALARKDDSKMDNLISIITKLKEAFEVVSKDDKSGPVIKNVPKVYAGLTYGKNSLNEYTIQQ